MRYFIPASQSRAEFIELKSRFIGIVDHADSVEKAQNFISQIKDEFATSSHVAYAYVIGFGNSTTNGCNDDGEPKGTAGRPMLAVLQGCGLGDVVAAVVRYYGGTKLGTGGLVHAYADAIKMALNTLERTEKVDKCQALLVLPYALYERVKLLVISHSGKIISEDFAADITFTLEFVTQDFAPFNTALREMSGGGLEAMRV